MNPSLREGELGPAPLPSPPPAFLVRALLALRRAILGIADAIVPPELGIFDRVNGVAKTALLGFVARAGVADLLRSGPLSAEEIAQRLDTQPDATFRVLRGLATDGVFQMLEDGRFDNNPLSLALRSNNIAQMRAWVEYFSSRSNMTAWMDIEGTLRTGRNAFDRAYVRISTTSLPGAGRVSVSDPKVQSQNEGNTRGRRVVAWDGDRVVDGGFVRTQQGQTMYSWGKHG